jgi:hypothetical protein
MARITILLAALLATSCYLPYLDRKTVVSLRCNEQCSRQRDACTKTIEACRADYEKCMEGCTREGRVILDS